MNLNYRAVWAVCVTLLASTGLGPARAQEAASTVAKPGAETVKKAEGAPPPVWQPIFSDAGRRMEIDSGSIKAEAGKVQAWGRVVFERPVPDAVSGASYLVLEALNRYDCNARTFITLQRVYRKNESEVLREEIGQSPAEMPVRTGTLDDKVLRFACRPTPAEMRKNFDATVAQARAAGADGAPGSGAMKKELQRTNLGAAKPVPGSATTAKAGKAGARKAGAAVGKRPAKKVATEAAKAEESKPPAKPLPVPWSYDGATGPENWGSLAPEYELCAKGQRQSPIDIDDSIKVDLPPIEFAYRPSLFRIVDNGNNVQAAVSDNSMTLLGKRYELVRILFHRPSEERVNGRSFEMAAHLIHRSEDGKLAIVAVMLEKGAENGLVQTIWNHLPLESNVDVYPPGYPIDASQLLPEKSDYYTYMGSLTTPPCSEGVLWLVLKNPVAVSEEQIAIFARVHPNSSRPPQPRFGRLVKESR